MFGFTEHDRMAEEVVSLQCILWTTDRYLSKRWKGRIPVPSLGKDRTIQ